MSASCFVGGAAGVHRCAKRGDQGTAIGVLCASLRQGYVAFGLCGTPVAQHCASLAVFCATGAPRGTPSVDIGASLALHGTPSLDIGVTLALQGTAKVDISATIAL